MFGHLNFVLSTEVTRRVPGPNTLTGEGTLFLGL